jgi:predicted O-methyltransferase YrrM
MGLGLEETGGSLTTIEIDTARHELARRHISEAGLSQRVMLVKGDAHLEVAKIAGPFDFIFLDADKEGQADYFNKLYPKKLVPGGMLAAHNAIRQAGSMKDYLDLVRDHPDFDTVTLSATMDDGYCLSYRHRRHRQRQACASPSSKSRMISSAFSSPNASRMPFAAMRPCF